MRCRLTPWRVRIALVLALGIVPGMALVRGGPKLPAPTRQAWTTDEALAQLKVYPHDPYLQYVALQLARRENRLQAAGDEVERLVFNGPRPRNPNRRDQVDLFSIFTGALAVQESLQLDTMRGQTGNRQPVPPRNEAAEKRRKEVVDIANLTGPTIKSHPWKKMLGDKKPEVGPLARNVPEDFYFIEFRSLTRLLELMDSGDLWGKHLFNQASREARSRQVGERLRGQLVVETNRLLRPLYDTVVEEVAVTGSDLFFSEGSDVTLLFRVKQPEVFKARMDGFLASAARARRDARRTEDEYLGVPYVHLATPERDLNVYSAYPEEGLHVRSNSKAGFRRVVEAIKGKTSDGQAVRRLGDSTELAYVRTLMPRGAPEEDGFVYLSDPFIRHLVGPQLKLTERRRMLCYNHLRMAGHASLLFRTEFGRPPRSLDELVKAECCPGKFNEGDLVCRDGGKYTLSADGSQGVCSHHGHAQNLVPCCETPLARVTAAEAGEYRAFLNEYNSYWRTFFDPIAVRVQVTPRRYRLETIILPLIDNSIYTGMAKALNGKPEPLDALPVPKRTIFSVAGRFNKETLLKEMGDAVAGAQREAERQAARELGIPEKDVRDLDVVGLLTQGLGNQVGLHVYDAPPLLDLDMPGFLGLMFGSFNGRRQAIGVEQLWISFVISSLNAPVYIALPVRDAKVVDRFLAKLDTPLAVLARRQEDVGGFLRFEPDFYTARLKSGETMRSFGFRLGPVKWRFHWARVGGGLYIASKPFILDDLAAAEAERARDREGGKPEAETTGHAMLRLRPRNWDRVLADYRLGWAENNRQACLANLGPLASVGRAVVARSAGAKDRERSGAELGNEARRLADRLLAVHFFCPEGGRYELSSDGKTCSCSIHGNATSPRQALAPNPTSSPSRVLQDFGGLTATLTFLEDGLHAVFMLERK